MTCGGRVDSSLRWNDIREKCDAGVPRYRLSPVWFRVIEWILPLVNKRFDAKGNTEISISY